MIRGFFLHPKSRCPILVRKGVCHAPTWALRQDDVGLYDNYMYVILLPTCIPYQYEARSTAYAHRRIAAKSNTATASTLLHFDSEYFCRPPVSRNPWPTLTAPLIRRWRLYIQSTCWCCTLPFLSAQFFGRLAHHNVIVSTRTLVYPGQNKRKFVCNEIATKAVAPQQSIGVDNRDKGQAQSMQLLKTETRAPSDRVMCTATISRYVGWGSLVRPLST
jgi:hypothetical protein